MNSVHIIENNKDILLVCFGGFYLAIGDKIVARPFEFLNFFRNKFENIDKHFYNDTKQNCYHSGIEGISNNIDETVDYLKTYTTKYKKVIFMGNCAGSHAAILYGSLLNVTHVIAFNPLTFFHAEFADDRFPKNIKYVDLSTIINNTTKYYIFGAENVEDIKDYKHISQSENIIKYPNVFLTRRKSVNLKKMKMIGELQPLLNTLINNIIDE